MAQSMAIAMCRGADEGLVRPNHWQMWWRGFNGSNGGGGMTNAAEARGSASSPARRSGRGRLGASRWPTMSAMEQQQQRETARDSNNNDNKLYFLYVWGADINYLESCLQLERSLRIFDTE